ncbi:hypothetical protein D9M72_649030 [compost metagenome]
MAVLRTLVGMAVIDTIQVHDMAITTVTRVIATNAMATVVIVMAGGIHSRHSEQGSR